MKLAYGKFDPDLNPPPFSSWSAVFSVVEVDLFQYYSWKPKTVAFFNYWVKRNGVEILPRIGIRLQRSPEEYQDAIAIWRERFHDQTIGFLVHSGRKEWIPEESLKELLKLSPDEKYFFEWGKNDSVGGVEFIKRLKFFRGWVVDPDWHRRSLPRLNDSRLIFKLHGWCDERWVRRYGDPHSIRILQTVKKCEGAVLILSYSGKLAEAGLFSRS